MKRNHPLPLVLVTLAAGGFTACAEGEPAQPVEVEESRAALTAANGLAWNGLAWNGLAFNGLSFNGLSWNGLAYNGLTFNGLAFNGMVYNGLSWNGLTWNGLTWNGLAENGLAYNGLTWNGLTWNGLTWNGASENGLTYNGLSWNGLTYNGLLEPTVQTFVRYLASCALPEDQSLSFNVEGRTLSFPGQLGLAPEWQFGSCDTSCQRWITACMLARLNKTGAHVEISMRGKNRGLKVTHPETEGFPKREAAYFGNMFAANDAIYTCTAPGATSIPRVCGDSLAGCPMKVVGACDEVCKPGPHGSYRDCQPVASSRRGNADGEKDGAPKDGYTEAVTVFLRD